MPDSRENENVHRRVEWMVQADPTILEFLHTARTARGRPAIQTPKTIALNTGYSRKHVGNRCRTLADHGLIEKLDRGQYRLTFAGQALMDGDTDLDELSD